MPSIAKPQLKLTLTEAAERLGVSPATVRNWVRAGLLRTDDKSLKTLFDGREVNHVQRQIKSGKISKLRSRANKNISEKKHGHAELLLNQQNELPLIRLLNRNAEDSQSLLLALYLSQLMKLGLCQAHTSGFRFKTKRLRKEIADWRIPLSSSKLKANFRQVQGSELDFSDQLLSFSYQYICSVGAKQKAGAYYTPLGLVQKLVDSTVKEPGLLLDPCCGSGHFLIEGLRRMALHKEKHPWKYIFGSDVDIRAVRVARANLTMTSNGKADSLRQIRHQDALLKPHWDAKFKYVLTNPPWGAEFAEKDLILLRKKYPKIKSDESFSYFILAALERLIANGQFGFVLPDSFLNIKTHSDIRRELLTHSQVVEISRCDEKFSGVFTKSFTLAVKKRRPTENHIIQIRNMSEKYERKNSDILSDADCAISIESNQDSEALLNTIEQQGRHFLKDDSDWALGIVTGDNKKFLSDTARKGFEPVYTGTDVLRFKLKDPKRWLLVKQKQLQQVAPLNKYRSPEKLIYRFICKELVFAIDRSGLTTLNSANILIPHLKHYNTRTVCGILNSELAQFYYQKKFNTIKTLRGNLEQFPFPRPDLKILRKIEMSVSRLEQKYSTAEYQKLNQLVMDLYGLDGPSRAQIMTMRLSDSFHDVEDRPGERR